MESFMVNDIFTIISDSYTRLIQGDSAHEEADFAELHFLNFSTHVAHHSYAFRIILR
jgi:hypothetical protein